MSKKPLLLNKYIPHLSNSGKNKFIEDLIHSDTDLAIEAIHEFTQEEDLDVVSNIVSYFYNTFDEDLKEGKENIVKIQLVLDDILVSEFKKMIHNDEAQTLIESKINTTLPLNEKSFNEIIELSNLLDSQQQISYLDKIMDLSNINYSFLLTPQSQKVLLKNLDNLSDDVKIGILANTDLLKHHQLEKDFIVNNEDNSYFGYYIYSVQQKIGFRVALVLNLLTNDIENQSLIDYIKATTTEKECLQIAKVIERNEDGISLKNHPNKIKAIQKVIPFSQAKIFFNDSLYSKELLSELDEHKKILDFILEDPNCNIKTKNILKKDDLIEYFFYFIESKIFDNVHDLCNVLKLSYLVKEELDDNAIIQIFFNWLDKNKENIMDNLKSYCDDDEYDENTLDNIKIQLETQLLDLKVASETKTTSKSKKMKI